MPGILPRRMTLGASRVRCYQRMPVCCYQRMPTTAMRTPTCQKNAQRTVPEAVAVTVSVLPGVLVERKSLTSLDTPGVRRR